MLRAGNGPKSLSLIHAMNRPVGAVLMDAHPGLGAVVNDRDGEKGSRNVVGYARCAKPVFDALSDVHNDRTGPSSGPEKRMLYEADTRPSWC